MEMETKCATWKAQNKQIKRKPKQTYKFGPSTNMGMIQAHPAAHSMKTVAREGTTSAAAPGVRQHPHHCLSGPSLSGGALMTPRISFE